jgi:hypothetical protein
VLAIVASLATLALKAWSHQREMVWRYWQRAYVGPDNMDLLVDVIRQALPEALELVPLGLQPHEIDVEKAITFWSLRDEVRSIIDIAVPGPHFIFLPCGDNSFFTDYAWILQRMFRLFHGIHIEDQNFKGDALEMLVRSRQSALPVKACKAHDGTTKQIDAAFDLGEVLVIAECKVKGLSIALERGDPRAIQQRKEFVENMLRQVDETAIWLAHRPVGRNYDVSKFKWILGVGVTPFAEFIWTKAGYFWLTPTLPRVLTPPELDASLADGSIERIAPHHPAAVRIVNR